MRRRAGRFGRIIVAAILALGAGAWPVGGICGELVSDVQLSQQMLDLEEGGAVRISWRMAETGSVGVVICNLDGEIVKKYSAGDRITPGVASVQWDGRDEDGRPCPDGAYIPLIRAKAHKRYQVYAATMQPWGERLPIEDLSYDRNRQQITYRLSRPALCLIRVGETDGRPLFAVLQQWAPHLAGAHEQFWDGRDAQGLAYIADRPKLKIMIDAIALPDNAILVASSSIPHTFKRCRRERVYIQPPSGKGVFMHALHERRICRDVEITAAVENSPKIKGKHPVLRSRATILVDIPNRDHLAYIRREGSEIYAFMDGEFLTEVKVADYPARLDIDVENIGAGEHVLTVNLKGTEDHLGTYSLAVSVEK